MTHVTANVINDAFRAYEDDVAGGIASQTAIAAVDTNWSQDVDTKFHVAMLATETAGGDANNYTYALQYNLNSGGWLDVTTTTPIQSTTPTNCTTTNAASYGTTALTTGATIQATEYDTSGGSASNVSLNNASYEQTSCLQIDSAQVANNDTIQLRLTNNGTALDADTTIPTITVVEAVAVNTNVPLDSYAYNATGYSGNASYFIPVSTGSYTVSGQTLGVSLGGANTAVPLASGSYTVNGQALTINTTATTTVPLDSYAYNVTGYSGNASYYIPVSTGSYTVNGQSLSINTAATTTVALDAGAYAVTGNALGITTNSTIGLNAGSYTVAGQPISVTTGGFVSLDAYSYSVTGNALNVTIGDAIGLDAGSYTVAGNDLGVTTNNTVGLDAGSYTVNGQTLSINTVGNTSVPLDSYAYNVTGYSGNASYFIPVATGSYTVAGQTLGVTLNIGANTNVPLDAGSYTVTGYDLGFTPEIVGGTGVYTVTGQALTISEAVVTTVPLDAYGYTVTGNALNVTIGDAIGLDSYAYNVTGNALTISSGVNIVADAGSYTVTGGDISVTIGDVIGLDAYAYTVAGQTLGIATIGDTAVALASGSYTVNGHDATLSQTATNVGLAAGSYTVTGNDVISRVGALPTDACREPVQIVEIVQPLCANVFGSAPCTATGTADTKCYNTRATCQDTANYDGSASLSLFFSSGKVAERGIVGANYIIPSLVSVSTAPTRVNLASANPDAQGLGNRAVCSLVFNDHPHTDRRVDPYQDGRTFDPYSRGSFWSKWLVRNKYRQNIVIKVYEGYAGEALSEMTKRTYFLESATGPSSGGRVTIRGKDILARIEERKAQAPAASPGELYTDITNSATSFELANAVEADYPASGTIRINDELMTYTGRATSTNGIELTGVVRGTDGTTADEHSAEDAVQECLRYTSADVDDIVSDLLTTYGGVPPAYLDTAGWAAEVDTYLSFYRMSIVISEPTSVTELVSQLQENVLFYIWWDERAALVKMKAIRGIDSEPPTITAEYNILENSFSLTEKPRERVSRAWIFYQHRNYVDSLTDADSYRSQSVFADLESETDDLYGEASVRKIYAPWIQSGALADTTASKILNRFVDTPTQVTLKMDAKDRDYWVGDIVKISHDLDVDQYGERQLRNWTIIQAEETTPGEIVEYTLEDTTLYGRIHYVMAGGSADYPGPSAPFKNCYIGNAEGLLSDGTSAGRIN